MHAPTRTSRILYVIQPQAPKPLPPLPHYPSSIDWMSNRKWCWPLDKDAHERRPLHTPKCRPKKVIYLKSKRRDSAWLACRVYFVEWEWVTECHSQFFVFIPIVPFCCFLNARWKTDRGAGSLYFFGLPHDEQTGTAAVELPEQDAAPAWTGAAAALLEQLPLSDLLLI